MSTVMEYPLIKIKDSPKNRSLENRVNVTRKEEIVLPRLGACTKRDFKHLNNFLVSNLIKSEKQRARAKPKTPASKQSLRKELNPSSNGHCQVDNEGKQRFYNKNNPFNSEANNNDGKNGFVFNTQTSCDQLNYKNNAFAARRRVAPTSVLKTNAELRQTWRFPKVKENEPLVKKSLPLLTAYRYDFQKQWKDFGAENNALRKYQKLAANFSTKLNVVGQPIENLTKDSDLEQALVIRFRDLKMKSDNEYFLANKDVESTAMPFLRKFANYKTLRTVAEINESKVANMKGNMRIARNSQIPNSNGVRTSLEFSGKTQNEARSCVFNTTKQRYCDGFKKQEANDVCTFSKTQLKKDGLSTLTTNTSSFLGETQFETDKLLTKRSSFPDICENNKNVTSSIRVKHIELTAFLDLEGTFHLLPGIFTFENTDYDIWSRSQKRM